MTCRRGLLPRIHLGPGSQVPLVPHPGIYTALPKSDLDPRDMANLAVTAKKSEVICKVML